MLAFDFDSRCHQWIVNKKIIQFIIKAKCFWCPLSAEIKLDFWQRVNCQFLWFPLSIKMNKNNNYRTNILIDEKKKNEIDIKNQRFLLPKRLRCDTHKHIMNCAQYRIRYVFFGAGNDTVKRHIDCIEYHFENSILIKNK